LDVCGRGKKGNSEKSPATLTSMMEGKCGSTVRGREWGKTMNRQAQNGNAPRQEKTLILNKSCRKKKEPKRRSKAAVRKN